MAISGQNGTLLGGTLTTKPHDLGFAGVHGQAKGSEARLQGMKAPLECFQRDVRGGAGGIQHCVVGIKVNR